MPVATATVTVDDEGAVKGLRTMQSEFRELGDAAESASEGVEESEQAAASATSRFEQFGEEVQQTATVTKGYTNAQMQLVEGGRDMVQSLDRQADAMEQIQTQQRTLSTQTSKYNQIVFSTGDLVQDLQFGVKGAANNIAFMAEMVAEASQQSGGFRNVLNGIFSALKGPAGIILGIQALIALGPTLARWFSDREEEAKDLKKALDEAASGMFNIQEEIAGVEVENISQAETAVSQLETSVSETESSIDRLEGLGTAVATTLFGDESQRQQIVQDLERLLGVELSGIDEVMERQDELKGLIGEELSARKQTLNAQQKALKGAEETVTSFKARQQLQEAYRSTVAESTDEQEEAVGSVREWEESLVDVVEVQNKVIEQTGDLSSDERLDLDASEIFTTVEGVRDALDQNLITTIDDVNELISEYETRFKRANAEGRDSIGPVLQRLRQLRKEMKSTGETGADVFEKPIQSVSDLEQRLGSGAFNSIRKVERALGFLETELKRATSDEQRQRIRGLIQAFKDLKNEITSTQSEIDSLDDAFESLDKQRILAKALTENFVQFAKAVGQGENVMKSFGKAALGVLASVGTAMGKQLIAQGSALLASAILGPAGNAAAGAKLIAAGTALVAASQALSGVISGGGGGQGDEGQDIGSGGRAETGVEAPGRRRGGPVQAGRLYETHGLGEREFFAPSMDGQIITRNQMEGATNRNRTVNVETDVSSRVGVEDAEVEFDLGRLRLRLNELETKVDQVT